MADVLLNVMTDARHEAQVLAMMRALYVEDTSPGVQPTRFPLTIATLLDNPDRGQIVLIQQQQLVCGYALLIPYWSNEFGGTLLFIDELYIRPESRGRGLGRAAITWIIDTRPYDAVALALEVSPENARARSLYTSLGFSLRTHAMMARRVDRQ